MPLGSQSKALKVAGILEQRDMLSAAQGVCLCMATRLWKRGQPGAALTWALHCKNPTLISRLADKFLLEYSTEGELSCLDLLENLGEEMLLSDRLTFLAKYRELLREKDSHKAAVLLTALVDSQLAPHFFVPVLLRDVLRILTECPTVPLDSSQVSQLLACLDTLTSVCSDNVPQSWKSWTRQEEKQLREVLARHLGQALIKECSVVSSAR